MKRRYYRVELSFRGQPDFATHVMYVGDEPTKTDVVRLAEKEAHRYGYHGSSLRPSVRLLEGSALVTYLREQELPYYRQKVENAEIDALMLLERLAVARRELAALLEELREAEADAAHMNGEVTS